MKKSLRISKSFIRSLRTEPRLTEKPEKSEKDSSSEFSDRRAAGEPSTKKAKEAKPTSHILFSVILA